MVDHDTGEFLEVNTALLLSSGYTKEEFLKLTSKEITPPEYDAQELEKVRQLNEAGRFGPNEKEYIAKNGLRYPIALSGFLHTNSDGRKVVWEFVEDISNRKQAELSLQRSKESAESLAQSKSEFLAICHMKSVLL